MQLFMHLFQGCPKNKDHHLAYAHFRSVTRSLNRFRNVVCEPVVCVCMSATPRNVILLLQKLTILKSIHSMGNNSRLAFAVVVVFTICLCHVDLVDTKGSVMGIGEAFG